MAPKSGRARRGPALLAGIAGSALLGSGRGTVGVWLGDRARRRGAALAADRAWAADAGGGGGADCGAAGGCCGPEWRRRAAEPAGARHCSLVSLGAHCWVPAGAQLASGSVTGPAAEERPLLRIERGRPTPGGVGALARGRVGGGRRARGEGGALTGGLGAVAAARAAGARPSPSGPGPARWYRWERTAGF